jgi:hypothetical protein
MTCVRAYTRGLSCSFPATVRCCVATFFVFCFCFFFGAEGAFLETKHAKRHTASEKFFHCE